MKNKKQMVRIGLIQTKTTADAKFNLRQTVSKIYAAAGKGAKIICLQELFKTTYFCRTEDSRNFDLAESIPGSTTEVLTQVAKKTKVVLIASLFEKRASGIYHNTAVVINADGKMLGRYRKMHIPDDPGFHEKFYFVPGDLGFKVFETRYAKIGVLICWDQWFPEAARVLALKGAEIIFYPTAIGWKPGKQEETREYHSAWETIQRSHAIANGVFVAVVNRVGKEKAIQFWGNSFVADPFGNVIARAANAKEENLLVDCNLSLVEQTRREWPFLRDRRIDSYQAIGSRFVGNRS